MPSDMMIILNDKIHEQKVFVIKGGVITRLGKDPALTRVVGVSCAGSVPSVPDFKHSNDSKDLSSTWRLHNKYTGG